VYAGEATLRTPSGTPLEGVPQYLIVAVDAADPPFSSEVTSSEAAHTQEPGSGEQLITIGTIHCNRTNAEERFAAALAGQAAPQADGTPLYIKEPTTSTEESDLSKGEEKACDSALRGIANAFYGANDENQYKHHNS